MNGESMAGDCDLEGITVFNGRGDKRKGGTYEE